MIKVKETICTEIDDRGRVIRRTRTVDLVDIDRDDFDECESSSGIHRTSSKRIREAVEDYYRTKEW
jgi:hypothetical protein